MRHASAHAFLVDTSPRAGGSLAATPGALVFLFSEAVVPESVSVRLEGADGVSENVGPPRVSRAGTRLEAGLPELQDNVYVVNWTVVSAVDGHVEAGEFAFGVGASRPSAAATVNRASSWPATASELVFLFGLLVAIGGVMSESLVWSRVPSAAAIRAPIASAAALATAGAAIHLAVGAAASRLSFVLFLATRSGLLVLVSFIATGAGAVVAATRWRVAAVAPLLLAAVAASFVGHPASGSWWAAPANALHVVLAGMWLGALVHLVLALWRAEDDARGLLVAAARRYASVALRAVTVLAVAGAVMALDELETIHQLVSTSYGRVLSTKLLLVVVALVVAVGGRWVLRRSPKRMRLLRHLTSMEVVVLTMVVVAAAVLANTAPPLSRAAAGTLLGPAPLSTRALKLAARAGWFSVYLTADRTVLRIEVKGLEQATRTADIAVSGHDPAGRALELHPRRCGDGCFTMDFAWQRGVTMLDVGVSHTRWEGGRVSFAVPWPPDPAAPKLLRDVLARLRAKSNIVLSESSTSAPGPWNRAHTTSVDGAFLASQELYAAGGVTNLNFLQPGRASISVAFYVPGASTWYRLWLDRDGSLQRELIINPGHRIARELHYRPERWPVRRG